MNVIKTIGTIDKTLPLIYIVKQEAPLNGILPMKFQLFRKKSKRNACFWYIIPIKIHPDAQRYFNILKQNKQQKSKNHHVFVWSNVCFYELLCRANYVIERLSVPIDIMNICQKWVGSMSKRCMLPLKISVMWFNITSMWWF